jgi:hypothetical protein
MREHQASGKSELIFGHILGRLHGDLSNMMSDIYNTLCRSQVSSIDTYYILSWHSFVVAAESCIVASFQP